MAKSLKEKVEEFIAPKKEKKEEVEVVVAPENPGFDPDLPESKQRWLR